MLKTKTDFIRKYLNKIDKPIITINHKVINYAAFVGRQPFADIVDHVGMGMPTYGVLERCILAPLLPTRSPYNDIKT